MKQYIPDLFMNLTSFFKSGVNYMYTPFISQKFLLKNLMRSTCPVLKMTAWAHLQKSSARLPVLLRDLK